MHCWCVHSVAKAPILGARSRSTDPSETKYFLFDSRLFLDPDAILAVARWGALIVKWILRGLETSEVAGASPELPSRLVGAKCSSHEVDMRRLRT